MQTRLRCILAAVAVAGSLAWGGRFCAAETRPAERTIVTVRPDSPLTMNAMLGFINAEPVFVNDLLRPIDENLREIARTSRSEAQFREQAHALIEMQLKMFFSDVLIMTNAKQSLTEEDREKLDIFMNLEKSKLLSKYGGSEALANQALRAEGSSVDKALRDVRRRVTVELYLNKTLYPKIVITRDMVINEYQRNPKRWEQTGEIELYTLTLPVNRWLPREKRETGELGEILRNPSPEQVRQAEASAAAAAREIIDKLKKGADFATLVEDYNSHDAARDKGGRTPNVAQGSLRNEKLANYAFSLPANTIGEEPVIVRSSDQTGTSVIVVKIGAKKEARTVSFTEAQKKIEQEMRERQYRKLYTDYVQTLYKAAAIERVDQMANVALDVAVARYATK